MSAAPGLGPMEMTVAARDGLVLKGVLEYPEGAGERFPLAVLAHQYPSTSESYAPLVEDLLAMGVATLAFDLRGHGSSIQGADGRPVVIDSPEGFTMEAFGKAFMSSAEKVGFPHIANDLLRVASWGANQNFIDPARLLLVGASVGGTGALLAMPEIQGVRGVLTFAAAGAPVHGADADDRIVRNVRAASVPLLLTSAEDDPFDGAPNARRWTEGVEGARVETTPGDAHAMAIYYEVRDRALDFVRRTLGPAG